ncbi:SNF1-related protein kinase catalytic subunit alpha KIN10-like isoform X2 [Olea europaea var. sylvestris]|uniref:SNF1-related protein kinase catalytic subunit alpha KIN10-like isoform X2 n=1 Tax=Olea europaea var. sylvestris TaxID=158386 RepID=UPI000C1D410F|nr:SNF1-related protein kinase catalytic subunit alpha KIN10-like isoform X2 [Olea europaea var. sylvestris]
MIYLYNRSLKMSKSNGGGSNLYRDPLPHYKFVRTLGIGAFGKVKLAVHTLTGLNVAIKILDRESINNLDADKVRREINIMKRLSHPHIVRLFEVIDTQSKVYVVMEHMDLGELYDYVTLRVRLDEDKARHFFQQIISGIEYCHRHKVVHRDLKPENLLMDAKHNVKIADFGLGNITLDGHFLKTFCGTLNYAAPELMCKKLYAGPEVDVWSCGIILYALLCGRLPFEDANMSCLFAKVQKGVYPVSPHLSKSALDLISRILVVDPMKRISIPEIRQHPWFRENLPLYIASPSTDALSKTEKVDMDVLKEMIKLGFVIREVIGSLQNNLQNEATVTYRMLQHTRSPGPVYCHHKILESIGCMDHLQTFLQTASPVESNWKLGFKSRASPRETMMSILKVFQSLNVRWKEIRQYNMKCMWLPPLSMQSRSTTGTDCRSGDTVKFEIQLYKASATIYVLDLQQLSGPPFLFLEVCYAFQAMVT